MTIQHDLRAEGWMPGHLNRDVSPIGIDDVERIVIDERPLGFQMANHSTFVALHFPNGGWSPGNQNHEQSADGRILAVIFFGDLMFLLIGSTIEDGNCFCLRIATDATAKTASHPHQVRVVQFCLRAIVQPTPPGAKTTR
jgi:hypothetical protein